jgi:hypothetical protein
MSKHYQESEIEFRRSDNDSDYPVARGLVVYQYGGTIEECIANARKEFNLDEEWEVVKIESVKL